MTGTIPAPLRELWRRRAHDLASNVAVGSREHREIAHAATLIGEDYHDRFLIELIQNANDQALLAQTADSTAVVMRTAHLPAVSNGGQVVMTRNLERKSAPCCRPSTALSRRGRSSIASLQSARRWSRLTVAHCKPPASACANSVYNRGSRRMCSGSSCSFPSSREAS